MARIQVQRIGRTSPQVLPGAQHPTRPHSRPGPRRFPDPCQVEQTATEGQMTVGRIDQHALPRWGSTARRLGHPSAQPRPGRAVPADPQSPPPASRPKNSRSASLIDTTGSGAPAAQQRPRRSAPPPASWQPLGRVGQAEARAGHHPTRIAEATSAASERHRRPVRPGYDGTGVLQGLRLPGPRNKRG